MKKIIIMSLLATILMADNSDVNQTQKLDANLTLSKDVNLTKQEVIQAVKSPSVYSALGDVIYKNIDNIVKLKEIDAFKSFTEKINNYAKTVQETKEIGFDIQSGNKNIDDATYLNALRTLSKENDYFVRSVKSAYKLSIEKQDSKLFSQMVNSGLLDTDKNREQIVEYYLSHSKDINASEVIKNFLKKDIKKDVKKVKTKKKTYNYGQSKKLRDEAKIRRIREEDKRKQAELEKKLTEEVQQKKIEIRENQKKELFD